MEQLTTVGPDVREIEKIIDGHLDVGVPKCD